VDLIVPSHLPCVITITCVVSLVFIVYIKIGVGILDVTLVWHGVSLVISSCSTSPCPNTVHRPISYNTSITIPISALITVSLMEYIIKYSPPLFSFPPFSFPPSSSHKTHPSPFLTICPRKSTRNNSQKWDLQKCKKKIFVKKISKISNYFWDLFFFLGFDFVF
jgi:hypothetical protein